MPQSPLQRVRLLPRPPGSPNWTSLPPPRLRRLPRPHGLQSATRSSVLRMPRRPRRLRPLPRTPCPLAPRRTRLPPKPRGLRSSTRQHGGRATCRPRLALSCLPEASRPIMRQPSCRTARRAWVLRAPRPRGSRSSTRRAGPAKPSARGVSPVWSLECRRRTIGRSACTMASRRVEENQ